MLVGVLAGHDNNNNLLDNFWVRRSLTIASLCLTAQIRITIIQIREICVQVVGNKDFPCQASFMYL